jgi:hypothetical protein
MDSDSRERPHLPLMANGDRGSAGLDHVRATASPGTMWALLRQAPAHQIALLMPEHPSPKRLAGLRSWIQACVKDVSRARGHGMETADGAEARAQAGEIATQLAAIADAFSMYTRVLERSRIVHPVEPGLPPTPPSLVATADDEKLLLACRAALRRSMEELIITVEADG